MKLRTSQLVHSGLIEKIKALWDISLPSRSVSRKPLAVKGNNLYKNHIRSNWMRHKWRFGAKSVDSWELWFLSISTVLGKIDKFYKNGRSNSIINYFIVKNHMILLQFGNFDFFFTDSTKLQICQNTSNLWYYEKCIKNLNQTCEIIKLGYNLV